MTPSSLSPPAQTLHGAIRLIFSDGQVATPESGVRPSIRLSMIPLYIEACREIFSSEQRTVIGPHVA